MRRISSTLTFVLFLGSLQVVSIALAICQEEAFSVLDEGLQRALLLIDTDRPGKDIWCVGGPIVYRPGVLPGFGGSGITNPGNSGASNTCPPGPTISPRDAVLTPRSFGLAFNCMPKLLDLVATDPQSLPPTVVPSAIETRLATPHERWYIVSVEDLPSESVRTIRNEFRQKGSDYGSTVFELADLEIFLLNVSTIKQFGNLLLLEPMNELVHIMENAPLVPAIGDATGSIGWPNDLRPVVEGELRQIAIVDTGVSRDSFADRLVLEACFSSSEYLLSLERVTEQTCPTITANTEDLEPIFPVAENGTLGTQHYRPAYAVGKGAGDRCDVNRKQPLDGCEHGTQVAFVTAGTDSSGDHGLAPGADVISIQVASVAPAPFCPTSGGQPCAVIMPLDVLRALNFLHRYAESSSSNSDAPRLVSVNLSLQLNRLCNKPDVDDAEACDEGGAGPYWAIGSYATACENPFSTWTARLAEVGVHTVIAAGNRLSSEPLGVVSLPACVENAITVGSSTASGAFAEHSNLSSLVDFLAPGTNIAFPLPGGPLEGTSFAAPFVSAALTLAHELHQHCEDPTMAGLEWLIEQRESISFEGVDFDPQAFGIDPRELMLSLRDSSIDCPNETGRRDSP